MESLLICLCGIPFVLLILTTLIVLIRKHEGKPIAGLCFIGLIVILISMCSQVVFGTHGIWNP